MGHEINWFLMKWNKVHSYVIKEDCFTPPFIPGLCVCTGYVFKWSYGPYEPRSKKFDGHCTTRKVERTLNTDHSIQHKRYEDESVSKLC